MQIIRFSTLPSTSDTARQMAQQDTPLPFCVTAGQQTAGRGQRGRVWESPLGNLYATFALPCPALPPGLASLAVALAVRDTLSDHLSASRLRLKWPNDVLLDGAKVAGILLETMPGVLLAGIGINLAQAPTVSHWPAVALNDVVPDAGQPDQLVHQLGNAVPLRFGQPPGTIRTDWQEAAFGLGKPGRLAVDDTVLHGQMAGIDADGRLRWQDAEGRISMHGNARLLP